MPGHGRGEAGATCQPKRFIEDGVLDDDMSSVQSDMSEDIDLLQNNSNVANNQNNLNHLNSLNNIGNQPRRGQRELINLG